VYVTGLPPQVLDAVTKAVKAALATFALSSVLMMSTGPAANSSTTMQARRVAVILYDTVTGDVLT
jgi:hypothetical protein